MSEKDAIEIQDKSKMGGVKMESVVRSGQVWEAELLGYGFGRLKEKEKSKLTPCRWD